MRAAEGPDQLHARHLTVLRGGCGSNRSLGQRAPAQARQIPDGLVIANVDRRHPAPQLPDGAKPLPSFARQRRLIDLLVVPGHVVWDMNRAGAERDDRRHIGTQRVLHHHELFGRREILDLRELDDRLRLRIRDPGGLAAEGRRVEVRDAAVSGSRTADLGPQVSRALLGRPGVAVVLVGAYISLNAVVIVVGFLEIVHHPGTIDRWHAALIQAHGNPLSMIGAALLVFPKLALGLSGFETGVLVMPLIRGDPDDTPKHPRGRIRNARKLLTAAAGIMSVNSALIRFIYPRRWLGRGVGLNATVGSIASAVGPSVASAILAVAPWPWLFSVNVPLGLVAGLISLSTLPPTTFTSPKIPW